MIFFFFLSLPLLSWSDAKLLRWSNSSRLSPRAINHIFSPLGSRYLHHLHRLPFLSLCATFSATFCLLLLLSLPTPNLISLHLTSCLHLLHLFRLDCRLPAPVLSAPLLPRPTPSPPPSAHTIPHTSLLRLPPLVVLFFCSPPTSFSCQSLTPILLNKLPLSPPSSPPPSFCLFLALSA